MMIKIFFIRGFRWRTLFESLDSQKCLNAIFINIFRFIGAHSKGMINIEINILKDLIEVCFF